MSNWSVPPLLIAAMTLTVGAYHLLIYWRVRRPREHVTFALLCFATASYDLFCAGLYSATSPAEGVRWQILQSLSLGLGGMALLWFAADYTNRPSRRIPAALSLGYLPVFVIALAGGGRLLWSDRPSIKEIALPFGLSTTYYEMEPAALTLYQMALGLGVFAYVLLAAVWSYREGARPRARLLAVATLLFFAGVISDSAVADGLYSFVYTIEYAFLAMVALMAVSLSDELLEKEGVERALQASERTYAEVFDSTSEAILIHDAASGAILDVNRAVTEIYGYSREEALSLAIEDLSAGGPEFSQEAALARVRRARDEGSQRFEWLGRRKDGSVFWEEVALRSASVGGEDRVLAVVRDIDSRKRAEEALRESQRFADAVMAAMPGVIYVFDIETRRAVYTNRNVAAVLGYTPEELAELGDRVLETLVHPEDAEKIAALLGRWQSVSDDDILVAQYRLRAKNGVWHWWLARDRVFERDQTGRVTRIIGAANDVTDRRLAEKALRESEGRFRTLAENVPGVIYLCRNDRRWTMLYLNDAVEEVTGYAKEEFLADRLSFADLYHPDDTERVYAEVAAALQRDEPFRLSYRLRHRNGEWRWIEEVGVAIRGDDGTQLLEGYLADVTTRKSTEEALRESEERYRTLVEASPSGIVLIDAQGRMRFANPSALRMAGAARAEELVGRPMTDFIAPEFRERVWKEMATTLAGRSSVSPYHVRLRTLTGGEIDVAIAGVRVIHDGEPATLGVATDISDRVRAEKERARLEGQLYHAQKMEAIGRLAGGVAHDFNNLLQAILNHAEALTARRQEADPASAEQIQALAKHGASLTRQLLLFSRREATRPETIDLSGAVADAAEFVRWLLRENIVLEVECAASPLPLRIDRGQLEQVVMNLALNASDAMPDGGRLTVRADGNGDEVWLEVEDVGRGIGPEIRDRIFEPFFTTKPAGEGSGLGLSVVHGIVSRHGGSIHVSSEPGIGTTFRVTFPPASQPPAVAAPVDEEEAQSLLPARGERALLVEDDVAARESLEEILSGLGFSVVAAGTVAEALTHADGPPFDVLLCDYLLPDGTAEDLHDRLAELWPGMAVILMSGYARDTALRGRVTSGDVRFLQKPFDLATLSRELRAAMTEGRRGSAEPPAADEP